MFKSHLLARCLSFIFLSAMLWAQGDRGSITGLVVDNSGAAVPNATIEVVNVATNARSETVSTGTGAYRLAALGIGIYNVTVKAQGFQAYVRPGVQIQTNQTVTLDVNLTVGAVTDSVTVQGGVTA